MVTYCFELDLKRREIDQLLPEIVVVEGEEVKRREIRSLSLSLSLELPNRAIAVRRAFAVTKFVYPLSHFSVAEEEVQRLFEWPDLEVLSPLVKDIHVMNSHHRLHERPAHFEGGAL